jgi:ParB family chromosome partitioning protein
MKMNKEVVMVRISDIIPNRFQPRLTFDEEALNELSNSIKEHGIIQPPLVEDAGNGMYDIIAGERRTRAARLAGLTQIPVRVKSFSEENKLEVALIENIQRENLNALEEALAYKKLMDMANITQDEVAKRVGKNRSTVANALRLLKLPEDMQTALADDKISAGHARALLSVNNSSDMQILFGRIIGQGLSVREAESQAQEMNGKPITKPESKKTPKSEAAKDPDLQALEQQLIEKLGTKVYIKGDMKKGSIQIEYFNSDDLDRIFDLLIQ